eukprot:m.9020 g.9020  ORF g.9020 m.9020 type:complete len:418 (-) comp9343_c0_seq1:35-1288(-)
MASWLNEGDNDPLSAFSRAVRSSYRSLRSATSPTTMLGLCRPTPSKPPPAYPFADEQAEALAKGDTLSISSREVYNLKPSLLLQRIESIVSDDESDVNDEHPHIATAISSHDTTSQSSALSSSSSNPSLHHIPHLVGLAGPVHTVPSLHSASSTIDYTPRVEPLKEVLSEYLNLMKLLESTAAARSQKAQSCSNTKNQPEGLPTAVLPFKSDNVLYHHPQPLTRQETLVASSDSLPLSDITPAGSLEDVSRVSDKAISPPWVRSNRSSSRRVNSQGRRLKLAEASRCRRNSRAKSTSSISTNTYDTPCSSSNTIMYRVAVEHSPGALSVGSSMILRLSDHFLALAKPNGHEVLRVPYAAIRRYGSDASSVKVDVGSTLPQAMGMYVLQCHTPARVLQALCRYIEQDAKQTDESLEYI